MFGFACCCTTEEEASGSVATISTVQMNELTAEMHREIKEAEHSLKVQEQQEERLSDAVEKDEKAGVPQPQPEPDVNQLPEGMFSARLSRESEGQSLGLSVEQFAPDAMYISKVDESGTVVGAYNARADEDHKIQVGQYLISVDTLKGDSAIDVLAHTAEVDCVIKRPTTFDVTLVREGLPLGIMLKYDTLGTSVYIKGIEDSGAAKASGVDLATGDRIFSVNGKRGSPATLMQELKMGEKVELSISRP